jgi:hypothetical protein
MESWITELTFFGGWEGQFILAIKVFLFSLENMEEGIGGGKRGEGES